MADLGYEFDDDVEDEVWLFCIDQDYYFAIPQIKSRQIDSRDSRVAERAGALPPPVAAAMAFASLPRNTDTVLDPVCGSGTLLAEFHAYAPLAYLHGLDIDPEAIATARQNLNGVSDLALQVCDSRKTNLQPGSVTVLLANLPFGKQFGDKSSNPELYRELLAEGLRLADPAKWRGVVLTSDTAALESAVKIFPQLQMERLFTLKIRGESATMARLKFAKAST